MSGLWAESADRARRGVEPLAVRMRPRTLDEFVGQDHLLGEGRLLRRMIAADVITSIILHGPPGTGKTTLAWVIAAATRRHFERENAASVGVKRIRDLIDEADARLADTGRRTILFLDEIHRFTRAQQDVLLGDVERGVITLVGATTENPLFACNAALVSRSTLMRLEPLTEGQVARIVRAAAADRERGLGADTIDLSDEAVALWATLCDGDARRALTALEVAAMSTPRDASGRAVIDRAAAEDSIQQKAAVYDGAGDDHYDAISAMIKSVRGSDPDAAIYWIARMLDAGEDPRFVARRLAILASEDIGNADPRGVMVAAACWDLVERIGMPECRITLAQCATYLALAPKSNAAYLAIDEALTDVRQGRTLPVPVYIKDANVRKASDLSAGGSTGPGAGLAYQYSHDAPATGRLAGFGGVTSQSYLGVDRRYYRPTDHGAEKQLAERLAAILDARAHAARAGPRSP